MVEPTEDASAKDPTSDRPEPGMDRRRLLWTVGASVLVAILVVVVGVAIALNRDDAPRSASSPATSPTPTTSATDSAQPTPTPAPTAEVESPDVITDESGRATQAPVPLDQTAEPTEGVTVALVSIEAVEGEASGPGEVAGPALRVTVRVQNGTGEPKPLQRTIVTLSYGTDQRPATEFQRSGSAPLAGEIAAGGAAEGVYVFAVPQDQRGQIRVSVDLDTDATILLFEGAAS
tara:strand:- start:8127 stop:8825 length:699 start_codon:yes stop_codon:yes gene_type:complete